MTTIAETNYQSRLIGAEAAVAKIRPGSRVFIATGAAVPRALVHALATAYQVAPDIETVQLLTLGDAGYLGRRGQRASVFFVAPNTRAAVNDLSAEYVPVHLSQVPSLIRSGRQKVDVALLSVTPPDPDGNVSLGPSVDVALAAMDSASLVIGQVNRELPRTRGASACPAGRFHWFVECDEPLPEFTGRTDRTIESEADRIGGYLDEIVPDEATIQCGIGSWLNRVISGLRHRRGFRIFTELYSDGLMELVKAGAAEAAGSCASFAMGSTELYRFLASVQGPELHPADVICSPAEIARKERMVSVNAALEIDLTGQVSADSLGGYFYSGPGGFADFQRGAALSKGGRPVVALRSTAIGGRRSRIVPELAPGAGVTGSRADIHWVVTEWGAVNLYGKSIRDRALLLSEVAHPDFRSDLVNRARERRLVQVDDRLPFGAERRYPVDYVTKGLLHDGSPVRVRPVRKSDEDNLRELFYSESEASIYRRFHSAVRALPPERIRLFFDIDYHSRFGLGVYEDSDGGVEHLIGLGSYAADPRDRFVEVAFLVRDDRQGRGVGTLLLERLTDIARSHGFLGLTAWVLTENRTMMNLFRKSGLSMEVKLSGSVYELRMPFGQNGPLKENPA